MQRSMNNKRTTRPRPSGRGGRPQQKRTPYCKVCYDAGKTKQEYTSHYVKDKPGPDGKVVCPYLLSLTCRYCHKAGHTPNHCPEVKAKEQRGRGNGEHHRPRRQQPQQEQPGDGWSSVKTPYRGRGSKHDGRAPRKAKQASSEVQRMNPRNLFAALVEADEKQAEERAIKQAAFPKLGAKTKNASDESSDSEDEEVRREPKLTGWASMASKAPVPRQEQPAKKVVTITRKAYDPTISWADMCESDYESEEEEDSCAPVDSSSYGAVAAKPASTYTRDAWDSEEEDDYCHNYYRDDYMYNDEDNW